LVIAVVAAVGAGTAAPPQTSAAPLVAAKTCRSGYVHAVIRGTEKCLHAGEFCAHSLDRVYRRYGFRCIRYDPRVDRYRLTRG
jgi:hypothetical protein